MPVYAPTYCPGSVCDPCKCVWGSEDSFTHIPTVHTISIAKVHLCGVPFFCIIFWQEQTSIGGVLFGWLSVTWSGGGVNYGGSGSIGFTYSVSYNNRTILSFSGAIVIYANETQRPPQYTRGYDGINLYYAQHDSAPQTLLTPPIEQHAFPEYGFLYQGVIEQPDPVIITESISGAGIQSFTSSTYFSRPRPVSQKTRLRVPLVGVPS